MRARNLQIELGYIKWENFYRVILKCVSVAKGNTDHLFKKKMSLRKTGNGALRKAIDYELNEADINLIKLMCGSHKPTSSYKIRPETITISLLLKYYAAKDIPVNFQFKLDHHVYDCKIGESILFEFDEHHHNESRQGAIDKRKNEIANLNCYTLVRATVQEDIVDIIIKLNKAMSGKRSPPLPQPPASVEQKFEE